MAIHLALCHTVHLLSAVVSDSILAKFQSDSTLAEDSSFLIVGPLCPLQVLVEEQSKMPWDVEEERQEQQNAAETAYEAMRQRRKRQAAKNRRAAKQSRLEQAMASMSAEEVMLQSLLREQEEALGGRAPEEVLR